MEACRCALLRLAKLAASRCGSIGSRHLVDVMTNSGATGDAAPVRSVICAIESRCVT